VSCVTVLRSETKVNPTHSRARQAAAGEQPYFSTQVTAARRFYLELHAPSRRRLSIASGGYEECAPEYDMNRHGFSSPVVEFVAKGAGLFTLGDRQFPLEPGSIFVYGPDDFHRIQSQPGAPLTKYFVAFNGVGSRDLMQECHILPGTVAQLMHPERIVQIFEDLIQHGLSDHPNRVRMCHVTLQYLMMKIGELVMLPGEVSTPAGQTYRRCRQFIEENYLSVHSLQEVAQACHVDSAYLCRLFKRFRRESPFQYLQNLRMNRAVDLLRSGDYSVKKAAQELGFSDPYNFSRSFKRVFGISPSKLIRRDS